MCGTIGSFIEQIPMVRYGKINIDMGSGEPCIFSTLFVEHLTCEGLTVSACLCPISISCDPQAVRQDCTRKLPALLC